MCRMRPFLGQKTAFHLVMMGGLLCASSPGQAENAIALANSYIPRLETMLLDNVASFWLNRAIDRTNGGYLIDFDAQGTPRHGGPKMIVTQARTVWFFSRLARAGYHETENLAAAEHGYRFLRDKMWDPEHGGFYWEVDATGDNKRNTQKHLYGQAFALYALSEYHLATQDPNVLGFAVDFFNLLDRTAHDPNHSGYREFFNRDWSVPPDTSTGVLSVPFSMKLMNTHLHLLEAFTTFYEASQLPLARARLQELILIQSNTMVVKSLGACTDKYDRNWKRRMEGDYGRVSYGHDIENIWLLMKACDAVGVANDTLTDLYRFIYDYSWRRGYDFTNGGFFDSGVLGKPADALTKTWWVQAEALPSALYMYRLADRDQYLDVFEQTFDFVDRFFADWTHGEWHGSTAADGSNPSGSKGQSWKCGYHNGRALLECIEVLRDLKARAEAEKQKLRR